MQNGIGERICQKRQLKKMTQEEFAFRLGVTPQAVSKWERGIGLPDVSMLDGICKILNISANDLLEIQENCIVENGDKRAGREIKSSMIAEPLMLEFGKNLISCAVEGIETDYINQKRKELVGRNGILLPVFRLRDNVYLEESTYRIYSYDKLLAEKQMEVIEESTYSKMIDHVVQICEENYASIINKQIVKIMVDNMKELFPGVADDLIPEKISYLQLERELQKRINKKESIRDLIHILEQMEEAIHSY